MLNAKAFHNSRSDGFGVLEIASDKPKPSAPRRFVPLKRTDLAGNVAGPLATLTLTQTFALSEPQAVIEALYRFPLPGDAAVTGVRVQFGDVEIHTTLKERGTAEADYKEAKRTGRQAALVTRESPDVFTLAIAGIRAGEDIVVRTEYVQVARAEGAGWSLRVPLTTAPRYIRADETTSRHAAGQPLALLRDPGHRFALDLRFADADGIASSTHAIAVEGDRVQLRDGEVIPDRDCVLTWRPKTEDRPALRLWTHADPVTGKAYFLALCSPPKFTSGKKLPREVVLLVDHSGSMEGAKWEATDWAVERFLAGLNEHDSFALGLFHTTTKWFAQRPRKATQDAVREAVAFLRQNRDAGGTELGVALEQALDRARVAETPSRHVLILTDAEVSDAGRVLRLADNEREKPDRRRVSVLCIDSAPNSALASELAERGGGVSRFLTSNPDEDDVTTALDEVLADWSAPVLTGLTLEVNRAGVEAAERTVALLVPGPASAIDIGDLPAGRPVWVIGRVPLGSELLSFRLRTGAETVAEHRVEIGNTAPGLKSLFGADRVRRLEYLMHANHPAEELHAALARLGYDTHSPGAAKVYAENARDAASPVVRDLLIRESLAASVPCSETAFVAVRSEIGQPVTETRIVANAQPHGWYDNISRGGGVGRAGAGAIFSACLSAPAPDAADVESVDSMLVNFESDTLDDEHDDADDGNTTTDFDPQERFYRSVPDPPPQRRSPPSGLRVSVKGGQHATAARAVIFDGAIAHAGRFAFLSVTFADKTITGDTLDQELTLLLFVGDFAAPRARVKLADVLRQGGRRPLNLRHDVGQPVRLTLEDPSGAWSAGVPALEIVLG
ncbi:MAG: VIT and VWA domain-containing protein [Planctomycetes bacterium]|nr:VIT and VWA domain-containing protein [Planctomycetota bacterium]